MSQPPKSMLWISQCTCSWLDILNSEEEAQKAVIRHRKKTHHWDTRIVPPKGMVPKDPRHVR